LRLCVFARKQTQNKTLRPLRNPLRTLRLNSKITYLKNQRQSVPSVKSVAKTYAKQNFAPLA
jgi:hypothetical protein